MNNLYFDVCMKWLVLLLSFSYFTPAFGQEGYPDYKSVLEKFFSTYQVDETTQLRVGFARKKDGWYAQLITPWQNDTVVSDQLFWSPRNGRYQILENFLRASDEPVQKKIEDHIARASFQIRGYDRYRYYGYHGWDVDMVHDYGKKVNTNDTLLDGLAAAYGFYATRLLWYHYGHSASAASLPRALERLEMPDDERAKLVVDLLSKSIENYNKIYKQNKNYEGGEGSIAQICFNAGMMAYLQMSMANRPEEARQFLHKSRIPYDDSVGAVNRLNSVGDKAILFVEREYDTYPIWYLQEKYGTRKDVAVINYHMLAVPEYVLMLRRQNLVNLYTSAIDLSKEDINYALHYSINKADTRKPLAEFVNEYYKLQKMPISEIDSIKVFNATDLYLTDNIQFKLPDLITITQLIYFDIISSNFGKRPIYFSYVEVPYLAEYTAASGVTRMLDVQPETQDAVYSRQAAFIRERYRAPFYQYTGDQFAYRFHLQTHFDLYFPFIKSSARTKNKEALDGWISELLNPFKKQAPYFSSADSLLPLLYSSGYDSLADRMAAEFVRVILKNSQNKSRVEYYITDLASGNIQRIRTILADNKRNTDFVDEALAKISNQ